jgi:hypothetical protein
MKFESPEQETNELLAIFCNRDTYKSENGVFKICIRFGYPLLVLGFSAALDSYLFLRNSKVK